MRLLLAGFEPFGGAASNPSQALVEALRRAPPPVGAMEGVVLPVTYAGAWPTLEAAIVAFRPDVLLATGLAGGLPGLAVERFAVNLDDGPADNAGECRTDRVILDGAPVAYAATLPLRRMADAIEATGVPAILSLSAGSYLCNHVLFRACHEAATARPPHPAHGLRCGFIHLPWIAEPGAKQVGPYRPSLTLGRVVDGLRAAIGAIADPG